jgi:adenosylmethionine-8-amino-7-oxononanoate aminotransferase
MADAGTTAVTDMQAQAMLVGQVTAERDVATPAELAAMPVAEPVEQHLQDVDIAAAQLVAQSAAEAADSMAAVVAEPTAAVAVTGNLVSWAN